MDAHLTPGCINVWKSGATNEPLDWCKNKYSFHNSLLPSSTVLPKPTFCAEEFPPITMERQRCIADPIKSTQYLEHLRSSRLHSSKGKRSYIHQADLMRP